MTAAHIALLVMAVLMAAEALWTIIAPMAMRERVGRMLTELDGESGPWSGLLWGLALVVWLFAWQGNQWTHRALFFVGVFCMVTGYFACRPSFLQSWYGFFLGRRSSAGIRLLYLGELLLAAGLGWLAVNGL